MNTAATWKPDWTLNRNIDPAEIGELVKDAFNCFHSPEEDPHQDGVRDILFLLQEKFYPGAVRVVPHEEAISRIEKMKVEDGVPDAQRIAQVLDWMLFEIKQLSDNPHEVSRKAVEARRLLVDLLDTQGLEV